ncbi:deoxyribose-phosphate aldolase [Nakamurella sp.]|uniref:deoxyribose-phosphate aldolase n=1 Tax=Nakamurella sp. TaxID=1869182 RepID=UPI003B3BBB3C
MAIDRLRAGRAGARLARVRLEPEDVLAPADEATATHPALVLPPAQLAGRIQHTLIGQAITDRQVREHVTQTLEHGFDAAIVPPCWVPVARRELRGTVARIGSIVNYPHGSGLTPVRVAEVRALVDAGVDELDATVNVGFLLSGRVTEFVEDLAAVVAAAAPIGVKLMLELPLLDARQRERAVAAAVDAGAAFVAVASRFSVGVADPAGVGYLRRSVPPSVGVKANGGIRTIEQVRALLAAGADLIGTSAGIAIVTGRGNAREPGYSY